MTAPPVPVPIWVAACAAAGGDSRGATAAGEGSDAPLAPEEGAAEGRASKAEMDLPRGRSGGAEERRRRTPRVRDGHRALSLSLRLEKGAEGRRDGSWRGYDYKFLCVLGLGELFV